MAKDYAKTSKTKPRGKAKAAKSSSRWSTYALLLFVGFGAGLFYIKHQTQVNQAYDSVVQWMQPGHHVTPTAQLAKKKVSRKPRFEFYSLLQESNTNNTNSISPPAARSVHKKKAEPKPASTASHFQIQVASLQNARDADRLKAQLVMIGFNVKIKPFSLKTSTWYRVQVGPFNSLPRAQSALAKLKANQFSGLLRRLS